MSSVVTVMYILSEDVWCVKWNLHCVMSKYERKKEMKNIQIKMMES